MTFLDDIGGLATVRRVHSLFYDSVFAHPWFSQIFPAEAQPRLESQQTDFMAQNFGGPPVYRGRTPGSAHPHIMITDEMFDERACLLSDAIRAAGVSDEHRTQWLRIDDAFRRQLVKKTVSECKGRHNNDPIIDVPRPAPPLRRAG